ncbi:hypothetical protein HK103_007551 [Boothiomyces macroporosus]|uniref:Uncharacterized protein n=1 Tax=Boothiomyces macroporosus TaxID=261099 RepID=A0AAD5UCH7_9FUNG|nr:hypothetical protein HK103_007551 [Boothiomyces macroporosus]
MPLSFVRLAITYKADIAGEYFKRLKWRGYRSRKFVFDFYNRQEYIQQIMKRMDKMRVFVQERSGQIMEERHIIEEEKRLEEIDKYARNHHHLLGTKNVPGVPLVNNFLPSILKDNSGIQECLAKIGKNPRKIRIKPKEIVPHSPKEAEKKCQGPFLVLLTNLAQISVESGVEKAFTTYAKSDD